MTDTFVPTDLSVRIAYTYIGEDAPEIIRQREEAFDRWLADHDRRVVAAKLNEMANQWADGEYIKAYLAGEAQSVEAARG